MIKYESFLVEVSALERELRLVLDVFETDSLTSVDAVELGCFQEFVPFQLVLRLVDNSVELIHL